MRPLGRPGCRLEGIKINENKWDIKMWKELFENGRGRTRRAPVNNIMTFGFHLFIN
jgi:hypothetical protein